MSTPHVLQDAVARFLARYSNIHTARGYRQVLEPFCADYGPQRALSSISPEDLDDWNGRVNALPITETTRATRRKAMKVFFNWCVARGYLAENPARFLAITQPRRTAASKAMPGDVLEAIFQAAAAKRDEFIRLRDLAILSLLRRYGARAGDVVSLRMGNVNFAEGWIVLRVKGGHQHRLPLVHDVTVALVAWLEVRRSLDTDPPHDFMFVNNRKADGNRHTPLSTGSVSTLIKRLSQEACGVQYGPHAIRHWRGQSLMDSGVPATVVQQVLGHSDVQITLKHYANQDFERVAQILNSESQPARSLKLPPMDTTDPAFWRRGRDRTA